MRARLAQSSQATWLVSSTGSDNPAVGTAPEMAVLTFLAPISQSCSFPIRCDAALGGTFPLQCRHVFPSAGHVTHCQDNGSIYVERPLLLGFRSVDELGKSRGVRFVISL